ncbi:MAG: hypothetical protein AAF078_10480, partial [Planctomycetota bacterium]
QALGRVAERALHPEGVLVLRTPSEVPALAGVGLRRVRSDAYGGMSLHLYERPGGSDGADDRVEGPADAASDGVGGPSD